MRPRRPGFTEPEVVFSNKSTTSTIGIFHPLTVAGETAEIKSALRSGKPRPPAAMRRRTN